MPTEYTVTIDMSQETVTALNDRGYFLYVFKGVKAEGGSKGAAPLVWIKSQTFSLKTEIKWTVDYQAYTSIKEIKPNTVITASASYPMNLGQTLKVDSNSGTGTVIQGGTIGAVTINNRTETQFSCGMTVKSGNDSNPICALPLYGKSEDIMAPIEKILMMFATKDVNTGTVIEKSITDSIFIDMTGATGNKRMVEYQINKSWSWDKGAWAQTFDPDEKLAPLLIESM